jgi:DNA invertase Pin-like site-specific DNA recombinase
MAESEKGKKVVFVFPVYKWILMLLNHPNFKEVRNLKDVKKMRKAGKSLAEIAKKFGVTRGAIQAALKRVSK